MSANQIHDITSPYLHRHLYHSDMWHRSDIGALRVHPGLAGIHAGIYHNAISVASNSQLPFMFSWSVVHCMPGTVCSAQCSMHHSDREVPPSGARPGCCRIPASQSIPQQAKRQHYSVPPSLCWAATTSKSMLWHMSMAQHNRILVTPGIPLLTWIDFNPSMDK